MNQLRQLWARLSWRQRIWIAVAVLAVAGALSALNHWNQERDFKPLFSGLAPEDAGAVAAKLRESGVDYRLADNGSTILVPSEKVAQTRLDMASAGLPKTGRIGFELFDKANFGASEFTEQVNYHRAIEGELERSVMSIREVEAARVHVTFAKDSLYADQRQPAKASVLVQLRHAGSLSPQNVAAVCQLVASAVPGLSPDQVSLLDTNGNLLNRPHATDAGDGEEASEAALEYRKSVEHDVQAKVAQTLDPLLGSGHFRVGASADVDLTSGDQSEETYDPQKSVISSSQTTQDGPALAAASGIPGTPSNVPRPAPPSTGSANYARHTESVTYQTSRVVKHTKLPQGSVKRMSVSVLVDYGLRWQGTRRIVEPPSAEKLKVIHDLTAAAVGLDPMRGDQLVVEAFPFESTLNAEPLTVSETAPAPASNLSPWLQKLLQQKNAGLIAGIGAAAMLVLLVGLMVLMRRSKKKRMKAEAAATLEAARAKQLAPSPEEVEKQIEDRLAAQSAENARQEAEELMKLRMPQVSTKKTDILTKHISEEAKKDPSAMAQVVRSWLHGNYRR
jgi:flagellar M-ring protein FliF